VIAIAPVARRGGPLAGLFLAAYFGIAVPVLGLGVATQLVSAQAAVPGFAAVLAAAAAAASRTLAAGQAAAGRRPAGAIPASQVQAPAVAQRGIAADATTLYIRD
jgi:hypothetical protein